METRIRLLLLSAAAAIACGGCASRAPPRGTVTRGAPVSTTSTDAGTTGGSTADNDADADSDSAQADASPPAVVEPQVQRRTITVPQIKSKNVEIGAYYGVLSIQDFGAQPVAGVRLDYHVTEDFFFEADATAAPRAA